MKFYLRVSGHYFKHNIDFLPTLSVNWVGERQLDVCVGWLQWSAWLTFGVERDRD